MKRKLPTDVKKDTENKHGSNLYPPVKKKKEEGSISGKNVLKEITNANSKKVMESSELRSEKAWSNLGHELVEMTGRSSDYTLETFGALKGDFEMCFLCRNKYDARERRVKMSCAHLLCPSCIEPFCLSPLGFTCPFCSAFVPPNSFPTQPDLMLKRCKACWRQDEEQTAMKWCVNCHEPLCLPCNKYHQRNRATRNHRIIAIEDIGTVLKIPASKHDTCSKHNHETKRYCLDHGELCCIICWGIDHQDCSNYDTDVLKDADLDTLTKKVEEKSKEVTQISLEEKTNQKEIQERLFRFMKDVEKETADIIDHLNNKKNEHINQLKNIAMDAKINYEKFLEGYRVKKILLDTYLNTLARVKKSGSENDRFLSYLKISSQIPELSKEDVPRLEFNVNMTVCEDMKEIKTSSVVTLDVYHKNLELNPANCNVIEEYKMPLKNTFIYGGAFLSEDKLLLADSSHKCVLLADYCRDEMDMVQIKEQRNVIGKPYGMEFFNGLLYVTFPENKCVRAFQKNVKKIEKTINVGRTCRGISFSKEYLGLACKDSIVLLGNSGSHQYVKTIGLDNQCDDLHFDKSGNIIFTSYVKNTVKCMNDSGDILFVYKHPELERPWGLAIDFIGNIYVPSRPSKPAKSSLHVISPTGERITNFPLPNEPVHFIKFTEKRHRFCIISNSNLKMCELAYASVPRP